MIDRFSAEPRSSDCCEESNCGADQDRFERVLFRWMKIFTDPRLFAAIVHRLIFGGNITSTGTDVHPLAHTRSRIQTACLQMWSAAAVSRADIAVLSSRILPAAVFSFRCSMLLVPGMSIVFGECVSCHARPTCDAVTPRRKATTWTRSWSMTLGSVPSHHRGGVQNPGDAVLDSELE